MLAGSFWAINVNKFCLESLIEIIGEVLRSCIPFESRIQADSFQLASDLYTLQTTEAITDYTVCYSKQSR